MTEARVLTATDLRRLPAPAESPAGCTCGAFKAPGWESIGQPLQAPLLKHVGTLRDPLVDEPCYEEAPGASYWSADAPISPAHFPYNRCEVWACAACGRGFLQYTEFGGYYVDHRLREIDPARVI